MAAKVDNTINADNATERTDRCRANNASRRAAAPRFSVAFAGCMKLGSFEPS